MNERTAVFHFKCNPINCHSFFYAYIEQAGVFLNTIVNPYLSNMVTKRYKEKG